MRLIFIYGPAAAGKLTIARKAAEATGLPLFHNHLVVDAVAALFPFGSPEFIELRERFWIDMFRAAVSANRSLIFTFAPEPTVSPDFPFRVADIVEKAGGVIHFVALDLDPAEQERRLVGADRAQFGKLRSIDILRHIRDDCDRAMRAMPKPELAIRTDEHSADEAAGLIIAHLDNAPLQP